MSSCLPDTISILSRKKTITAFLGRHSTATGTFSLKSAKFPLVIEKVSSATYKFILKATRVT